MTRARERRLFLGCWVACTRRLYAVAYAMSAARRARPVGLSDRDFIVLTMLHQRRGASRRPPRPAPMARRAGAGPGCRLGETGAVLCSCRCSVGPSMGVRWPRHRAVRHARCARPMVVCGCRCARCACVPPPLAVCCQVSRARWMRRCPGVSELIRSAAELSTASPARSRASIGCSARWGLAGPFARASALGAVLSLSRLPARCSGCGLAAAY